MANTVPNVLDHILPSHDLYRRRCAVVWIWSLLSVVLLLLLLLVAGLLIGLLSDRGRLTIELPKDQVARFRELTGLPAGAEAGLPTVATIPGADSPVANAQGADVPVAADTTEPATPDAAADLAAREKPSLVHISYLEYGILPAVWRSRDAWWGESLGWLFRNVELLQSNILAAMTLLFAGAILWTARHVCLSRLRAQARHVALEAVAPTRRNVHRQALRLGPEDLDGSGRANATELYVVDVENVRRGLARWIETDIRFPLELLCLALVAVSIQPIVAAQFLLFLGIAWYYLEAQDRRIESEGHQASNLANEELRRQSAGFQSARLVRGLGIEQMDHDHFATQLLKFNDLARRQDDFRDQSQFRRPRDVAACAAIGTFLLFILTTHILLQQSPLSIASGSVFVATWLLAVPGTKALRRRRAVMHQTSEAAEKIQKYLDQIPTVSQAVGAHFLQPLTKSIHFDSVTYRNRAGHVLLDSLDLVLEAGRTYSLVSIDPLESIALASMLPRFIEPQRGRILFDGEDVAWATLESLRAETVFVGADEPLLPGNVLDNIRGGRSDYTLQQATEAAKLTHAHNFIVKMFDGYESELPERADLMDVAQRFRLGLARAMVRNPAVLIIEEPHIALDEDTKALLADAYDRICRDRTVIFLPGRMSTVRRSDQVLVLNEGRIAAIGPQSKLVNMSPIYRHWEYVNFNEFRHQET